MLPNCVQETVLYVLRRHLCTQNNEISKQNHRKCAASTPKCTYLGDGMKKKNSLTITILPNAIFECSYMRVFILRYIGWHGLSVSLTTTVSTNNGGGCCLAASSFVNASQSMTCPVAVGARADEWTNSCQTSKACAFPGYDVTATINTLVALTKVFNC